MILFNENIFNDMIERNFMMKKILEFIKKTATSGRLSNTWPKF